MSDKPRDLQQEAIDAARATWGFQAKPAQPTWAQRLAVAQANAIRQFSEQLEAGTHKPQAQA